MNRKLWIRLAIALAWPHMGGLGQEAAVSDLVSQERPREELRRVTVDLSTLDVSQTLVNFSEATEPPWSTGNCLYLAPKRGADSALPPGEWFVCNMHAENFRALLNRDHLERLELGLLDDKLCLVVDSRVPEEWLIWRPCRSCLSLERRLSLRTKFDDFFQKSPQVESLVGTTWVLDSRKDPDGLLERALPGRTVEFRGTELVCRATSGEVCGRRSWECNGLSARVPHSGYSVLSTRDYAGGAFVEVTRDKDRMVVLPTAPLRHSSDSVSIERYQGSAIASYHREQ